MKSFALAALVAAVSAKRLPTAVFHGMGDQCINPGMHDFTRELGKQTGAYARCVEVGAGAATSLFKNFQRQAEMDCEAVLADENFQGEFNVLGLSQGALIARYIAESCPVKGQVRNLSSIGGPNMGVADIPQCFEGQICSIVNYVARDLVYYELIQDIVGPAGYFRDPWHMDRYLSGSVFLPYLNNETGEADAMASNKERFSALNGVQLIMFTEDSMVFPKESEWFHQLDQDNNVIPLEETDFYINDYIGLRALNEAGRVHFESIVGDHLQFTDEDIAKTIVPFLLS